jgi:actin-like ATPase involved in cell morphogenesis
MILKHETSLKKESVEVMVASQCQQQSAIHYSEAQRRLYRAGAMNEPSAAAVEFLHRYLRNLGPRSPKRYVAVYDLGGGTFDTSVVGIAEQNHDVVAHEGIGKLGGDDFDEIILNLALEQMGLGPKTSPVTRTASGGMPGGRLEPTQKRWSWTPAWFQDQKPVVLDTGLV